MMTNTDYLVIGGGISGLTAAFLLKEAGMEISVLEADAIPGGSIKTVHENGWTFETGPNTIVLSNVYLKQLIDMLDLNSQIITADRMAAKRYVVRNKKPVPLPSGPASFLVSSLFSTKAKLRLLREPFIRTGTNPDESLADFVKRRLGQEFLDYAINPFVAGVYAGNPDNLSARLAFPMVHTLEQKYGSLIKGQFKIKPGDRKQGDLPRASAPMISLKGGNKTIADAMVKKIGSSFYGSSSVARIVRNTGNLNDGSRYTVHTSTGKVFSANKLICTAPLNLNSGIMWEGFGDSVPLLNENMLPEYPPLAVVHLGIEKENIEHSLDGFGLLVPECEEMNILGCLFSSTIFENRTPNDSKFAMLTCFAGGSRNPGLLVKSDEELVDIVMHDLKILLGLTGKPAVQRVTRWNKAIPQYDTQYDRVYKAIENAEKEFSGLYFLGNFMNGIAVPDCIRNAFLLTEKITGKTYETTPK
ncbi:MAG: protoporphyrinogen oxidase [Balneolales bacterium]|nr:protoporphyrinogen oxidase [Balneolales bacterium]